MPRLPALAVETPAGFLVDVRDFGAELDGTTDDGPAWTAAFAYASALAPTNAPTTVWAPKSQTRIRTTINAKPYVRLWAPGVKFVGPIDGYPRISGATAVASATSVTEQVGGAAISDLFSPGYVYGASFESVTFIGFRYAVVTVGTWDHPRWTNCFFEDCDIGIMAYQGTQLYRIRDCASGGATPGTTFVGSATAFPTGHPYVNQDNFFCAGLLYENPGGFTWDKAEKNDALDDWFEASILRPDVVSYSAAGELTFAFPADHTARKVSGRPVYIPARNRNLVFNPVIRDITLYGTNRGLCLVANPIQMSVSNIQGEGLFQDMDGEESLVAIALASAVTSWGDFNSLDGDNTTYPGKAITVYESAALTVATGEYTGSQITGGVVGGRHFIRLSETDVDHAGTARGLRLLSRAGTPPTIYDAAAHRLWRPAAGPVTSVQDESTGLATYTRHWSGIAPTAAGGARISARLSAEGSNTAPATAMYGTLALHLRRLDTGAVDYGCYRIALASDEAVSTTLAAGASSGASQITLTSSSGWSEGAAIVLSGTDAYVLKTYDGSDVWTLFTPLRATYSSGASAAAANAVSEITAQANGWMTVAVTSGQLNLTNAIAGAQPVQFSAVMTYGGPPQNTA